jgi:3-oxoacyl-[acyl-carrier protein] reductase
MNLLLAGKVAAVAGSSRGIGKAIAEALLAEGCRVSISGRESRCLTETQADFSQRFGADRVSACTGDLTLEDAAMAFAAHVNRTFLRTDILVVNVGSGRGTSGWDVDDAEAQRLFALNFWSAVRTTRAFLPALQKQGGCILFIASIAGIEALPAPLAYSAAKSALITYAKNLSRLTARDRVRVNCIAPGNVLFPGGSWEGHLANRRQEVLDMIESEVPMNRFGSVEEIASLAVYLCSDKAAFITGACFVVDGGQTRTI